MQQNSSFLTSPKTAILVFTLSILVPAIWYGVQHIDNIYSIPWVGAFFEIIWLPMIALFFSLPVLSLVLWWRNGFTFRSLYLYSFIISVAGILWLIFVWN